MVADLQERVLPDEVRELIDAGNYDRPGLRQLAAFLPAEDAVLHRWLAWAGEALEEGAFRMLFSAAALSGRILPAALIPAAMALREGPWNLAWVAWRMEGDVTAELLRGLENVVYNRAEMRALALFVAAAWWQKHRPEEAWPTKILQLANELAKEKTREAATQLILQNLASLLAAECGRARVQVAAPLPPAASRERLRRMFALLEGPYEKFVYEKMPCEYRGRQPQRRAVERIGRNEVCRCGSGKKYKHCCASQDRERLRFSSALPGVTRQEIAPHAVTPLTAAQLEAMGLSAAQIDPARVPPELQVQFLSVLLVLKQYEKTIAALRHFGVSPRLHGVWSQTFEEVSTAWRPDIARALLEVFPNAEEALGTKAHAGIRLLLVGDDPAQFLETLESESRRLLASGDHEELQRLMWCVLDSPYRALAIVFARSLLPIAEEKYVSGIFEGILEARAKLNLPPEEPFSEWMDQRALRRARQQETAAMQDAQDKLSSKIAELRRAKEERARLERELALHRRHERRERAQVTASAHQVATQERAELKAKLERLDALVKERGEERLQLRRALEASHRENEALKASSQVPLAVDEGDEAFAVAGNQPVRLLDFPKDFAETLSRYPRHVGRAAMARMGRIASGEPEAFERVKQLKAYPGVLRARVADKYRLLFALEPGRVRVVDLIRRADLERRIERLQAGGLPAIG